MGCIQSKGVRRQNPTDAQKASTSNGISRHSTYQNNHTKTNQNGSRKKIDLDMRSPREDINGLSNENLGFAEDLRPVSELPDTMTIISGNETNGTLTASSVSIKPRSSAHSSRMQNSRNNNDHLSIEELDTDMDDFSKLRPDSSRYIPRPGERMNPSTTDILLPRRKETPFPNSPPDRLAKHFRKPNTKTAPIVIKEESETSDKPENSDVSAKPNSGKKKKGGKNKKKGPRTKRQVAVVEETLVESINDFSSIEGTIKIDNVSGLKALLDEDQQLPSTGIPATTSTLSDLTQDSFDNSVTLGNNVSRTNSTSNVYALTDESASMENETVKPSNKVLEATHELVQGYLKDIDVAKVGVNPVFQNDREREKARMARKRKRIRDQTSKKESKQQQSTTKPSDKEIGHFLRENERQDTPSLNIRPSSKTSYVSIASMPRYDSSENIFDTSTEIGGLATENTMDGLDSEAKLVDLDNDDIDDANLDETMDNKSVHSMTSLKSSYGIKPYQTTTPQALDHENCSLRDIGFDVPSVPSSSNLKTKEKLMYSRHARQPRPMSESVLRLAGKPPLPPSSKPRRPHSETTPRGMQSYSRYMAVDTDLF